MSIQLQTIWGQLEHMGRDLGEKTHETATKPLTMLQRSKLAAPHDCLSVRAVREAAPIIMRICAKVQGQRGIPTAPQR